MRNRAGHLGESQELVELPVSTDLLRVVDADGKARSGLVGTIRVLGIGIGPFLGV